MARKKSGKSKTRVTVRRVHNIVKRALDTNTEDKETSVTMASGFSSIGNTWAEYNPFPIAQGVQRSQRVGNRIRLKSLELRGTIVAGAVESALDDPWNVVRIVIGLYNLTNTTNTPMTYATIGINDPISPSRLLGNLVKKIYYDKYIPLQVTGSAKSGSVGYAPTVRAWQFKKYFKNVFINYIDTGITNPNQQVFISMISDSSGVPNPGFTLGWIRAVFEDA